MSIKNQINQLFQDFSRLKVLVVGDVMIDAYYSGKVDRISPEAPVPIVAVKSEENRLGGAANVAINIRALEAEPILCTVIGDDRRGQMLLDLCKQEGIRTDAIISDKNRITTTKTRVIGNNHQLLRVDTEILTDIDEPTADKLIQSVKKLINQEQIDVIIFQDYDKGVITKKVIDEVVKLAKEKNIPTTADPKKKNFLNYVGVTLFKPNLKELREGLNAEIEHGRSEKFDKAVIKLKEKLHCNYIFITLSDEGVFMLAEEEEIRLPAHRRDIADVSGAGDTVISVASLCLALGQDGRMIAFLSNLAGGLVCEKVGVVPIERDVLLQEAISSIKID